MDAIDAGDEPRDVDQGATPQQHGHVMQDTPPRADVDEILRRKRKARDYKVRDGSVE